MLRSNHSLNTSTYIPLASLTDWFAREPLEEADRTGGGQAGGLLFGFALVIALRA